MAPILYVLGVAAAAVGGYFRYEQPKVGDILTIRPSLPPLDVPIRIKVTGFDKGLVLGTVIGEVNVTGGDGITKKITQDTGVPVSVERKNIIANLTPRLM